MASLITLEFSNVTVKDMMLNTVTAAIRCGGEVYKLVAALQEKN